MGDERSRRQFLLASGAVGAGALLAGCTGDGGSGGNASTTDGAAGGTGTATDATTGGTTEGTGETTTESGPYSASIAPMGEVQFESVPKTWVANNGSWADMGVALGVEPPKGVWLTSRYHTQYYDDIPGVSVDKSGMVSLYSGSVDKETFYNLDADVHVMDPNFLQNRFDGWDQSDVDEVAKSIAPFFGNSIFSRGYSWHENYQYYTLYEAFEKLALVFKRTARYEAFASLHDEFQSTIESNLPGKSERPSVAFFWASGDKPEEFLPYLISKGTSFKQWRDLGVSDALAETNVKDFHSSRAAIGFETLLEIDPPVLLLRGQEGKTAEEFQNTVVSYLKSDPVASDLSAVKNGRVFRAGGLYQGPITNLVLTQRAANQVYPDAFGNVSLFDPQRVADIVGGDV